MAILATATAAVAAAAADATPSDSKILAFILALFQSYSALPGLLQVLLPPLFLGTYWVAYNYLCRLRGVPGPLLPRLGVPGQLAWYAIKLEWVWKLEDMHKQYGPVVRIAPNHVDFCSSTAVQKIYGHGGSTYLKPKNFYDGFVVIKGRPSIFSDTDPHSHAMRRRAVSSAYALNYLVKLEGCVDPLIDLLIAKMKRKIVEKGSIQGDAEKASDKVATFDMSKVLHFFAMDAVGELAFGKGFGFVEAMEDPRKFLRGVSNLSQWGGAIAFIPSCLGGYARQAFKKLLKEPGGEVIGTSTRERITARYQLLAEGKEPSRADMLAKFSEAKDATGKKYSPEQILYTATSVVAAGSDTTSLALSITLRYLMSHPGAYEKLQAEVDEAFETGKIAEPCQYSAAVKLDYLQACVKEGLRLHPPISMSLPRVVPPEGDVIDGRFYPGGTVVSVSPYVLHRDKSIWGADAAEFRPERWLDIDDEERRHLERNFFSFGGGSRQCIGKNISMMEITKTLPRLLWHFSFKPTSRSGGKSPHTLPGRGTEGNESDEEPWHVTSSWFLNAEQLYLDVSARRPEELDL